MPSTPGPQVPGGYPRDSVVFGTNQWDHSTAPTAQSSLFSTAKTYLSAPKAYLPPAVASYFPAQADSSNTSDSSTPTGSPAHTPLHTDGSIASDFSTHAHAGRGSSRSASLTPTERAPTVGSTWSYAPSLNADPTADPSSNATSVPTTVADPPAIEPRTIQLAPAVVPVPSVALPASNVNADANPSSNANPASESSPLSSSTTSSPSAYSPSTQATTPSSASPASPHAKFVLPPRPTPHGFGASVKRFASLRHRDRAEKRAPPPSAFASAGNARGASPDSAHSPVMSTVTGEGEQSSPASPPMPRRHSLLRTLRGEATVIAGRVRGDRAKVERGKKMVAGEV
ncbi:hypothetical protein B0H12DRAFT_1230888 [Mycena haematopus]|nr:hypothetical protein B0H12DRAFT_1230888 [Mycena haematopus]